ncbi:MAG: PDZ domain-containing protein [Clostridia bacterium]|nr:PDZ domain-containing protein [Clostridia bacterium]
MFIRKKFVSSLFVVLFAFILIFSAVPFTAAAEGYELYLGGFPAGFVLNTTSVEVVGISEVMTDSGLASPGRECGLKTGDIIKSINGTDVNGSSDVNKWLYEEGIELKLTILRGEEEYNFTVKPVKDVTTGKVRLGILIKDSLSGVGTVTYIDKTAGKFASLGHPVTDTSNNVIGINGGCLYGCIIYDVKKGVRGTPGELNGAIESNIIIGKASVNTPCGVFGEISADYDTSNLVKIEKGDINDVNIGKAQIYSTINENTIECYDISIVKVDKNNKDKLNFVIKIEDKDLISATGGIVQGMSGSPIVQNGKLIGAVTHVFVNDPTRGFGISVENMMNAY